MDTAGHRSRSVAGRIPSFSAGVAIIAALALCGCGGSSRHATISGARSGATAKASPPPLCRPSAHAVLAQALRVTPVAVSATTATGNNGEPECHFGAGRHVRIVVNVDGSPQAYKRLERAIVEAGQQFGLVRGFAPPQTVPHLGLDASWFPDDHQLMTTDGTTLISVTVAWPKTTGARQRVLAARIARLYLGRLNPKAADPVGT